MMQRMVLRRRGVLVALVTATAFLLAALVQRALLSGLSLLGIAPFPGAGDYLPIVLADAWNTSLTGVIPFAAGVFLSLWQIAPIAAELRLAHVVTRVLLAAAAGALAVIAVGVVVVLVAAALRLGQDGSAAAAAQFAELGRDGLGILLRSATTFVGVLPTLVLAGVLEWTWLMSREHSFPVEGMLDL